MVMRAMELGYGGIGICDTNGFYGIARGYQAAERPSAFDVEELAAVARAAELAPAGDKFHYLVGAELTPYDAAPIALLPLNKDGYARLSHLITAAKRPSPKGYVALRLNKIILENEDLFALPLPPWNDGDLKRLQDAFQDRLALPVHKDFTWSSVALYRQALRLERELGVPIVATQRPLYHAPERKPLFDVLTCILHGTTLEEAQTKLAPNAERALKPLGDLASLWRERPDALRRAREIANRVSFSLSELRYRYPQEAIPKSANRPPPTPPEFLRQLVDKGLEERYAAFDDAKIRAKARAQAESELALIREMEYEDYFLTVWDVCAFARERGILHQGRGSAANSIVCFALGITSVDPIKFNLLFERFVSRERGEPPDIDVDFEHERREEVIQYIYAKYGSARAAMVCVTVCYRSRMAIRDVGKVLGFAPAELDALVRRAGREGLRRLIEEERSSPLANGSSRLRLLLRFAAEIQGFPRHLGIHSGGFVVSHDPITDIVPVEKAAMDGRYVIQWNKDDIATLGLMKVDVLSLGMLTAIRKAFALVQEREGRELTLANLPADDRASYDAACKADTVGVFQIESRAQMSLLPRLKPRNFYDLVVEIAIVRPGPIQGGMVHPYLRRREKLEKATYPHECLRPILEKTLGVPLFQEQVMQIAVAAAGFTPGEADELRRMMSSHWHRTNVLEGLRKRLIDGMLAKGIASEFAEQIYKTIQGFSSYGFPESHSASFALLTFASLYLKVHHPEAFVCALLNSQPMGFYSSRSLIADAQRHGVVFTPLDVQTSAWDYLLEDPETRVSSGFNEIDTDAKFSTVEVVRGVDKAVVATRKKARKSAVRAGFRAIYGMPERAVDKLVHERQQGGPFRGLDDFIRRTGLSRALLLKLASAGALRSLMPENNQSQSVPDMIWALQGVSFDAQSFFFGSSPRPLESPPELPTENDWRALQREYKSHGYSLHAHPMSVLRPQLAAMRPGFSAARDLAAKRHRTRVRVAGLLAMIQKPPTAKGMCFLSLEDETGLFNAVLTPDVYETYRLVIVSFPLLDIEGLLESRSGTQNIKVEKIRPLRPLSSGQIHRELDVANQLDERPGESSAALQRRAPARQYLPGSRGAR